LELVRRKRDSAAASFILLIFGYKWVDEELGSDEADGYLVLLLPIAWWRFN
jgi:hypothetical protein